MQAILVKVLKGISAKSSKCEVYDNDINFSIDRIPRQIFRSAKNFLSTLYYCLFARKFSNFGHGKNWRAE